MFFTNECKSFYQSLFYIEQFILKNTIFRNNFFETVCDNIKNKNEIKIIQDIDRLLMSFSKILTINDITYFKHLIETVDKS